MVDQILHRNLRIAYHRLAGALQQPSVSTSCPRDGGFHCLPAWLRNTSQHNLGQAVHESEQGLLGSPETEDLAADVLDARNDSLLSADDSFLALA